MSDPAIHAALREAAHAGWGTCGEVESAADAIAAFHQRMAEYYDALVAFGAPNMAALHRQIAAAVEEAARGD